MHTPCPILHPSLPPTPTRLVLLSYAHSPSLPPHLPSSPRGHKPPPPFQSMACSMPRDSFSLTPLHRVFSNHRLEKHALIAPDILSTIHVALQERMNAIIKAQWDKANLALLGHDPTATNHARTPKADSAEALAMATTVFIQEMDPTSVVDPKGRRVKGSLRVLLRRGLGRWAGGWILETFQRDALQKLVPLLDDIDTQYQAFRGSRMDDPSSGNSATAAFCESINAIHSCLTMSRQLTYLFDEQLRSMNLDPSLEVSSRFLVDFSAELAIRLPPSFDQVALVYFERVFQHYESHHPGSANLTSAPTDFQNTLAQDQRSPGQELGKKKRRVMQDGRTAMDLFVDGEDDEVIEQLFHGHFSGPEISKLGTVSELEAYQDLCLKMEDIGFASHMTDIVTRMLYSKVEGKIFDSFKETWSEPTLESGKDWMSFVILPFLRLTLLPKKDREDPTGRKRFKMWASRLEFYFFKTFGDLRIREFFDIILHCPESTPAVLDLKKCVEWTGQREQLQKAILVAMEERLLHPGAETVDIIEFYISAIKYIRLLDPIGIMLDHTARSINQYLRTRDDTMRAIVSCILDDSSNLLTNSTEGIQANAETDEDASDDEAWVPEPANAGPDLSSARRRMADTISVLANIYDNNVRFIKEFQEILASRLLLVTDFNVDREARQLELLKLRFGETDLHLCEVMLADMAESKKVNANIHTLQPTIPVDAIIASRFYWPKIQSESFELPEQMSRMMHSFNTAFEHFKPAQKLDMFPSLGMVEIELELKDRTILLQVQPIHAAIIHLFEEKDQWTLSELASRLRYPEDLLELRMQFWLQEGVMSEPNRFQFQLNEYSTA